MVNIRDLIDQHAASEPELHIRAAETFRKITGQLDERCNYKSSMLSCSNGMICYYRATSGMNMTATVEYRGNIIRTILSADADAEVDVPDVVMFSGANTDDAPAMLVDVPAEYRRTSDPLMLKMFFFEDTDEVDEQCPTENETVETYGNDTINYTLDNTTFYVSSSSATNNTFLGMAFEPVGQAQVNHTNAFEIPANTEIVWVSREEMVDVFLTQEMPVSLERRLEAQLRRASLAKGGMDRALSSKGGRRRRRRRSKSGCTGGEIGAMAGGAAAIGLGFATCAFSFGVGCIVGGLFSVKVGAAATGLGACNCWAGHNSGNDAGRVGCAFRR